jgi:hypothetical protein
MALAVVMVPLLAGCGAKESVETALATPLPSAAATQPPPDDSPLATTVPDASPSTPAATPAAAAESEAAEPEIIAESSNTVSDKEKQQILDELSSELDKAIGTLDELDEPDDSDLSADSIE